MLQSISNQTSLPTSETSQKSSLLGESIDQQYGLTSAHKAKKVSNDELAEAFELLIQEHLLSDTKILPPPLEEKKIEPIQKPTPPSAQIKEPPKVETSKAGPNWQPCVEQLDTESQQRVISERIITIKHSAANALANIKFFLKDLSSNIAENKKAIASFKKSITAASKTGGANFELVQSYKQPLNLAKKHMSLAEELGEAVDSLSRVLNQVEAGMDFIDIDVSIAVETFMKSVKTYHIHNDFSHPLNKIDELLKLLSDPNNDLKKAFVNAETISQAYKTKIKAIKTYLQGPKNPELIKKPNSDFELEMNLIKVNLNFLNKCVPILKGCLKGKDFLKTQLTDLKFFVNNLKEMLRSFVAEEYRTAGREVPGLCYNEESIQNALS